MAENQTKRGRPPLPESKAREVVELFGQGVEMPDIAARCGIALQSVYKIVAQSKEKPAGP